MRNLLLIFVLLALSIPAWSQKKKEAPKEPTEKKDETPWKSETFSGLKFRSIGPAITSGRISDIAVHPTNPDIYYAAAASGGVWKTENHGTTFKPIFDGQATYSIGCIALAPSNPHIVWVGTGENNAQRSVAYGDGVYKSEDGGKSWKNVGLKQSEHIGKIVIHPTNPDIVWVAAQGPVWSSGGDRGLYKTTDGGKTWRKTLEISENTGVNEVIMDPRDPNVLYASAWQRRRHVYTFISGGPESALYKSVDGGETWEKSQKGIPSGDLGRIGLAISPVNPDVVYAVVEAEGEKGGFFRSQNRGASWERMSGTFTSGNYYQEIICDPADVDRVYLMDTYALVTNDGGKTFGRLGETNKHVDNHALWINPANTDHYLIGCDGGLYESWDRATTWQFKANLPITQFYRVTTDRSKPFYFVYGGTQDNYSMGGPSRTINAHGITNSDWFMTNGGDGFESQVDPTNPNIVYAQAQYGYLVRYDKKTGETVFIQPQPGAGEAAYRWNWDAPLLISPHNPQRLYFAANKLFRTNDRGDSWEAISPDLTAGIDRNQLPVMGKVWSVDAVAKNKSTSIYGNIVSLTESPKVEGLIYVGTDDGLVQVTEDGGKNWRKIASFPGVPETTYVSALFASRHDANTVYAAFDNHKNGDFKPYVLKSTDRGLTWTSLSASLPGNGSIYCFEQDYTDPDLIFCGSEFGVFFSRDGGAKWIQMKSGLPTIAVRDMEIQPEANDLVLATFGRGFYVLDDYTPLRNLKPESLGEAALLFPVKEALAYVPATPLGSDDQGFQGASYYRTENPAVGAVFTWYLKEGIKTRKEQRQEREKKLVEEGKPVPYPSFEEMRAEDQEEAPYLLFTVTDAQGNEVRRLKGDVGSGIKRITWDLRYPSVGAINPGRVRENGGSGRLVAAGTYRVTLSKVVDGVTTRLAGPVDFQVKYLGNQTLPGDPAALAAFEAKVNSLAKEVNGMSAQLQELTALAKNLKTAFWATPQAEDSLLSALTSTQETLAGISTRLEGDASLVKREFETPPSVSDRIGMIVYSLSSSTTGPTKAQEQGYAIVAAAVPGLGAELAQVQARLAGIYGALKQAGAPYVPGGALLERK
jgi:photosystem II stability/assembly factor-like uncharacterized protein